MDLEKQQQQQHAPNTASLSRPQRFLRYCANDIDKESAFWPLLAYTAIAGYASAVSFCATWTYAAFQSANSVQIGIALGPSPRPPSPWCPFQTDPNPTRMCSI